LLRVDSLLLKRFYLVVAENGRIQNTASVPVTVETCLPRHCQAIAPLLRPGFAVMLQYQSL
jgi:hypothetical protein